MKRMWTLLLAAASAASLYAGEILPLSMGNAWTYRDALSGQEFTIRVGAPVWTQAGRVYHYLSGYARGPLLARVNEAGDLVALNEETRQEEILTAFSAPVEQWWNAPGRPCIQDGQVRRGSVEHESHGGRWRQAIEIAYRGFSCADAGVESEQFVDNIGMVRRVVSTIAGPRVFDLVHARIGTMVIDPIDRGRFTATVVERPSRDGWDVTLRLDIGFVPAIRLPFDSAQEFEVVLRDSQGSVVWKWSDGKVFAPVAREKTMGNLWAATIRVPMPHGASSLEGYTVDGWLTTSGMQPKFAASAPLPPPRVEVP